MPETNDSESPDGIHWDRRDIICIDLASSEEGGVTRSGVVRDGNLYRMWYFHRGKEDYRKNPKISYRIGYAEADDGITWSVSPSERVSIYLPAARIRT